MVCLVLGDANADLSAKLAFFPREGDDAGITNLGWQSGGSAANVAVAMARLGGKTRLLACVGEDPAADVALGAAKKAGVDLDWIKRDRDLATGICFAAVSPGGERTFFSSRGANVALTAPLVDYALSGVASLHVSGHALLEGEQRKTALRLMKGAHHRGLPVSLDLCLPLVRSKAADVLKIAASTSVIFANTKELAQLGTSLGLPLGPRFLEAESSALLEAGAEIVVVKDGADGSWIHKKNSTGSISRTHFTPMHVTAIDTTGAGDGFVGAFLFARLKGASPELAAHIGNVVGALVASRPGAAESMPSREEVRSILSERGLHEELGVVWLEEKQLEETGRRA